MPEVSVASETQAYVTDGNGQVLGALPAGQLLMAKAEGSGIQLGPWQASQSLWIQPSRGGSVAAGRVWYRGKLQLVRRGNLLLAVNYVDLEHYLYSVVGSEMPSSWSAEALKAQAVAARSYAIAHMARPASSSFDLGATPRWQAYTGQQAEDSTVRTAVDKTAGLILSYRGGIVESLYAATDEIVAEAHGHLGASMSQTGANQLGQQGYRYTQILAAYYPGAQLARLNISQR
jgi:peptidoglycan hydrolase-like amidase